ncbi:phytoene/squalene synthase family protein [Nocardioides dongxiaopingii]|uniref:phytoene/squalene synthase family protein n=1 Tax=Nocardioides dongxiaopingii TaxID=2576036 RepID=UPI0010C76B14|nr:squalene/phytoene synthase family protein [Nocardioides dongxiaopingii]
MRPAPHETYDDVADASAALVIGAYSSSFGLASRLLAEPVRHHVRNVYALVRVADEVVDAPRPDAAAGQQAEALATLEEETLSAMRTGQSSNLVVHAFARTARRCGVEPELVVPFFASMRTDLERREHDAASFAEYVYGSSEVVGLMCLRAFVVEEPDPASRYDELAPGARRLGAAFQKVNFLRDLGEDHDTLGRSYFPGIDPRRLTDAERDVLLDDIDADLAAAAAVVRRLPRSSRLAVCAAHDLFADLSTRLRATPAAVLRETRVRVPHPVKARLVAAVLVRGGRPRVVSAAR